MSAATFVLERAADALRLCQHGDEAQGLQRYREALASHDGQRIPVGLHAALLAGAGYDHAAAELRRAAMHLGLDVSGAIWSMHRGNYTGALDEYRQCFDAGVGTAYMWERYLVCLSRLGLAGELAAMVDPAALFRRERIDAAAIDDTAWSDLAETLRRAPARQFQEETRSVRRLDRVRKTHLLNGPSVVALHAVVRQRVDAYVARVRAADHPIGRWLPQPVDLRSWAVIADGNGGYNVPHTHGGAWVVAIAYVQGHEPPPGSEDGILRIGAPTDGDGACVGWPDIAVAPVPRTLVIMPGFYTHWTLPLTTPSPRVSVAFNVVSRLRDDDPNRPLQEIGGNR